MSRLAARVLIAAMAAVVVVALWLGQAWQDEKRRADCLQAAIEADGAYMAHDCAR